MDEYEYRSFTLTTGGGMSAENVAHQLGGSLTAGSQNYSIPRGLEAGSYTVTTTNILEIIDLDTSERIVQNWSNSSSFVVPGDSPRSGSEGLRDVMPGASAVVNFSGAGRDAVTFVPPPKRSLIHSGLYPEGLKNALPPNSRVVPLATVLPPGARTVQPPPGVELPPGMQLVQEVSNGRAPSVTGGAVAGNNYEQSAGATPFVDMNTVNERTPLTPPGLPFQIPDETQLQQPLTALNAPKNGAVRVHITRQSSAVRLPGPPALPAPPPLQQKRVSPPDAFSSSDGALPPATASGAALTLAADTVQSPPAKASSRLFGALAKPPSEMRGLSPPPPLKSRVSPPTFAEQIVEDEHNLES
ncbi:MAG: hypothetical protein K2W95_29620 [Candidatus Obscuribacterales bacterium]|nr:hypothetical protein [Candidatus Obscuribacterales bacterium]